jgi:threonine/homoserine/homoserine lactone efflux protein
MTYLALVAAHDGRRAGFAMVAGIALGLAVVGAVAGFGVAKLIQASHLAYETLRWAGVLFPSIWRGKAGSPKPTPYPQPSTDAIFCAAC